MWIHAQSRCHHSHCLLLWWFTSIDFKVFFCFLPLFKSFVDEPMRVDEHWTFFSGYCYLYFLPLVSSRFVSKNAGAGAKIEKFYFPNYAQYRGEGGFDHSRNSFKIFSPLPVDPSEFWCRWPLLTKKNGRFSLVGKRRRQLRPAAKTFFYFVLFLPFYLPRATSLPKNNAAAPPRVELPSVE